MSGSITEVNKETFWALIAQAKESLGDPAKWLKERLMALGPDQAVMFSAIAGAYRGLAHEYGLWTAASVIDERYCSNEGFDEFKLWLGGQGKQVDMAALADPDSLADVPDCRDARFVSLPNMGRTAYEELKGGDVSRAVGDYEHAVLFEELRRDIVYGEGIGYPYDWADVPAYLPRLYAKCYTEEQRRRCTSAALRVNTWNPENAYIKAARKVVRKGKKGKGGEAR